MIGFNEAIALVAAAARPIAVERVSLEMAQGQVLASDVFATIDSPRCDVSAMDGYAVHEADLAHLPARLRVVGQTFAGQESLTAVAAGECTRIFTGGALPPGADRVVVQEAVEQDGEWVVFRESLGSARHVRAAASDFAVGERVLAKGTLINARSIIAAAAADLPTVEVWRRPRFIILSTGDELAEPGAASAGVATIPDSVSLGVAALGREWGGELVRRARLRDDRTLLDHAAAQALADADLVVVTGGASVGEKDFARAMFGADLQLLFSKVAMKPGKPVWLGHAAGKLVLGLPGNPTSAMVTARLFLASLIAGLGGRDPHAALRWKEAPLARAIGPCGDRETFARARWINGQAAVLGNQDSGAQQALAEAELLVRRHAHSPALNAGAPVEVLPF